MKLPNMSESMYVAANVFDVTIDKPIIYSVGPNGDDQYSSRPRTGSRRLRRAPRDDEE